MHRHCLEKAAGRCSVVRQKLQVLIFIDKSYHVNQTFVDWSKLTVLITDPSKDTTITLGGKEVAVPQGKPKEQRQFSDSSFSNSEYLIYKESQCRLRFLLEINTRH